MPFPTKPNNSEHRPMLRLGYTIPQRMEISRKINLVATTYPFLLKNEKFVETLELGDVLDIINSMLCREPYLLREYLKLAVRVAVRKAKHQSHLYLIEDRIGKKEPDKIHHGSREHVALLLREVLWDEADIYIDFQDFSQQND